MPGRCASVLYGRVKSRTVSERNGVTLKFSCVHTVSNRRCATTKVKPAGRAAPFTAADPRLRAAFACTTCNGHGVDGPNKNIFDF